MVPIPDCHSHVYHPVAVRYAQQPQVDSHAMDNPRQEPDKAKKEKKSGGK